MSHHNPNQDNHPDTVVTSNVYNVYNLLADRPYTIAHDGTNESGATDTATFYIVTSGLPNDSRRINDTASFGKVKVPSGRAVVIGPGITQFYYQCNSGTPTFAVVPGPQTFGRF